LPVAAALGDRVKARALIGQATAAERHLALALAAQHGRAEILELLLEAGEDPNRYNPVGAHSHSTPLHQAAVGGHEETVRLLLRKGARTDLKDTLWQGTAADWADHEGKLRIAELLRGGG
jgi:ankyrin repeat protein